jgi:Ca2+-binding RTX toxin-like protein
VVARSKEWTMRTTRRAVRLLTVMGATLILASGIALAADVNCVPGVRCVGTNDTDWITGTNGPDDIDANGRSDDVFAGGGADKVSGGNGKDVIHGDGDSVALAADDRIRGDDDDDELIGYGGADNLSGGNGDDHINASERALGQPAVADFIDCGRGDDIVIFDNAIDIFVGPNPGLNCEEIQPRF